MKNYMKIIGDHFPGTVAYMIGNDKHVSNYDDITWESTPIPKETLDSYADVINPQINNSIRKNTLEVRFVRTSNTVNTWLTYQGFPTNEVPFVFPWPSKLIGMTFSNKSNNTNIDVEINSAGNILTWQVRDSRVATKTNINDVYFNQNNAIGLYIKKIDSHTPEDTLVTLYFEILQDTETDISTNNITIHR